MNFDVIRTHCEKVTYQILYPLHHLHVFLRERITEGTASARPPRCYLKCEEPPWTASSPMPHPPCRKRQPPGPVTHRLKCVCKCNMPRYPFQGHECMNRTLGCACTSCEWQQKTTWQPFGCAACIAARPQVCVADCQRPDLERSCKSLVKSCDIS